MSFLVSEINAVRDSLAGCESLQTWLGVDSADEASDLILLYPSSSTPDRFVSLELGQDDEATRVATGGGLNAFERTTSTSICFFATYDSHSEENAESFLGDISTIWGDFLSVVGTPPGKLIDRWQILPFDAAEGFSFQWVDSDNNSRGYQIAIEETGRVMT